jgi:hypothetical protein
MYNTFIYDKLPLSRFDSSGIRSTQNILYGGLMDVFESAIEQTRGTWFHWA